jgi:hypothetical protein
MSDDFGRMLNIIGLVLNLAGVLILFLWGMPFRVEIRPASQFNTLGDIALDHIYMICGYVGLSALLIGIGLQIIVQLLLPSPKP